MESNQITMPSYEEMVKAGMHFGRKRTVFHPNMKPFVYANRDNIHILDLSKTGEALTTVIGVLHKALQDSKVILFVGVNKHSSEVIKNTAEALKMPYVINRWLGGTLTNFKVISERVRHLVALELEQTETGFAKYTKKERILKEREIAKLREKYDGIRALSKIPDLVFVSSVKDCQLVVREAKITKVPVAGIVNTDSDPKQIAYPIPANDNSRRSVELVLNILREGLTQQN